MSKWTRVGVLVNFCQLHTSPDTPEQSASIRVAGGHVSETFSCFMIDVEGYSPLRVVPLLSRHPELYKKNY